MRNDARPHRWVALQLNKQAWGLFWAGGGLQRCRELLSKQVPPSDISSALVAATPEALLQLVLDLGADQSSPIQSAAAKAANHHKRPWRIIAWTSLALAELEAALLAEEGNKAALAAKADATCWVIEHLRGQAAYRQQQAKRLSDLARSDAGRADALEESLVFGSSNRAGWGVTYTARVPMPVFQSQDGRSAKRCSLPQGQWRSSGANRAGRPCRPASPVAMPPCPPW